MPPVTSTPMTMKRIHREIADLKKEDLGPIVLEPSDNLQLWKGSLPGPQGSVYEGGTFLVEIQLPNDYPFSAPKVVFKTRIYHMNISEQGGICIDILKHNWSPALSLFKVMLSLSSLLTDPNPKDPLVPSIATQYIRSRKTHDDTARRWTTMYACIAPRPQVAPVPTPTPASSQLPTAPPAAVTHAPGSPRSSRSRGKRREEVAPSVPVAGSSSLSTDNNGTTSVPGEVIDIDSGDEDLSTASKGKKRRRGAVDTDKRPRADANEVIELVESDEEEEGKTVAKKARVQRKPVAAGGSGASGSRRPARQLGDVIVIDD